MNKAETNLDIDALLENIRKEVKHRSFEEKDERLFQPIEVNPVVKYPEEANVEASLFRVKSSYDSDDFFRFDDVEFVIYAYRGLLHREPDEAGLSGYVSELRAGVSKHNILADLLTSDECKSRKVKVQGMAVSVWWYNLLSFSESLQKSFLPLLSYIDSLISLNRTREIFRSELSQLEQAVSENHSSQVKTTSFYLEQLHGRAHSQAKQLDEISEQLKSATLELTALQQGQSAIRAQINEDQLNDDQRNRLQAEQLEEISQQLTPATLELTALQQGQSAIRAQINDDQRNRQKLLESLKNGFPNGENLDIAMETLDEGRLSAFYRAFEDACRGEEEDIKKAFEVYLPDVEEAIKASSTYLSDSSNAQVLDVGCGRGEWLKLLKENTISALGVDLNSVMVMHCNEQDLSALEVDVVEHLKQMDSSSLSVISGFHIIEHLPFEILFALFDEAQRVLAPGGIIIFETPNPENLLVGSHTFYHDPTHRNPITPTFIEFLASHVGFADIEIRRLHPYPESAKVDGSDLLTERVNGHLCGPQDFAILAKKMESAL